MSLYPPQPWHLTADARVSIWRVPPSRLPSLPPGAAPLLVAGQASVFTAWIDYTPPGQLAYHELLAAVSIKARRVSCSITEIWVDSEASMAGGRELWAIPKGLATLDFTSGPTFTATAATSGDWIATAAFKRRPGLPLRVPTSFEVVQERDGLLRTPVGAKIRPRPASADWSFNPDGPLGYLDGRRPVASLELPGSQLRFGA
ncbi:acetoacetate decarboxylase family protein [Amycolatopsis sp. cg9]|uniref:acetoacetate decarboxylase family protein n=1 Tax=Amycolatopsis sp. cg9 TaxID=3238801 RepID=UPI0035244D73